MSLPKILDFSNYNRYPGDDNPTTDADMQDYLSNQNELVKALTDRLWQPETQYKVGDIVASPSMPPGLVAVCVIAGATSDVEPAWTGNETTVVDNYCTWEMRLAYSYALATENDVDTAYEGGSVENSRLMSMGIFSRLMACVEKKIRLLAYPVGSIYMSMNATNPAELFGGTWEQIAQGRCLIGAGTGTDSRSESKTFTAGATGGEYNHVLTVGEMPSHNHSASSSSTGDHYHVWYSGRYGSSENSTSADSAGIGANDTSHKTLSAGSHSHTITINNTGSNTAHNNIQPYLAVYYWKRTA